MFAIYSALLPVLVTECVCRAVGHVSTSAHSLLPASLLVVQMSGDGSIYAQGYIEMYKALLSVYGNDKEAIDAEMKKHFGDHTVVTFYEDARKRKRKSESDKKKRMKKRKKSERKTAETSTESDSV